VNWKCRYSDVVQRGKASKISMQKNPARYFLMAEHPVPSGRGFRAVISVITVSGFGIWNAEILNY
jgi:hypothetical protein